MTNRVQVSQHLVVNSNRRKNPQTFCLRTRLDTLQNVHVSSFPFVFLSRYDLPNGDGDNRKSNETRPTSVPNRARIFSFSSPVSRVEETFVLSYEHHSGTSFLNRNRTSFPRFCLQTNFFSFARKRRIEVAPFYLTTISELIKFHVICRSFLFE